MCKLVPIAIGTEIGSSSHGSPPEADPGSYKSGSSSAGRALASQAKGRGFEPLLPLTC